MPARFEVVLNGERYTVTDLLPEHLITSGQILELAGVRNPRTLKQWRERKKEPRFPPPIRELPGCGPVWDVREVKAWLKAR